MPGEPFTFTTASVTPAGIVTTFQEQGQRRIFDLGGTPLEMVWIPPGEFLMGSLAWEGLRSEQPSHRVNFAEGFWLGRFPVTQDQWHYGAKLPPVNGELHPNPSRFKGPDRPVDGVFWTDAQEFCDRLSQDQCQRFQLPSEAQWEYACRAGTTTPFAFGKTLTTTLANYNGNVTYGKEPKGYYRQRTTAVGRFPANGWGLHDMHGTVWEWCEDTWHPHYDGAPTDGSAWIGDRSKSWLVRGGSWYSAPEKCRSAARYRNIAELFNDLRGFRLALCCTGN